MRLYKCLKNQIFVVGDFKLVPIRDMDKLEILKFRNEQMYHLRQSKQITIEDQNTYFDNIVSNLFEQKEPNQLLFSVLNNNEFIGYGGLVHINWIDKHAEISFVMRTELEAEHFADYWKNYLSLLVNVAFTELKFHKIFTYAFDLRPKLYTALLQSGFKEEARLKEHCFFNGKYIDVLIHTKINNNA
ncbi:GNAT family N-acetyltransferase [Pedobacter sp. LMG 31464]|uniref:GNAT family N-acetyltransferase n=1 Tax=Pedobacter planticolens TaxID=2679964 RepID=A0A923E1N4_9SPHI|nr:GNAT family N-acetyltransferase [Pedobacter planticolens]MBB2145929.1 GNAT family N-acetyltransferase [Pedobacter planticolens]